MNSLVTLHYDKILETALTDYGLNPREWDLDFGQFEIEGFKAHDVQIQNVTVKNRTEEGLVLKGLAKIKKVGQKFKAKWLSLTLGEIA